MPPTAAGNFLYANEAGTGVFGSAVIAEIPQLDGGYRRRAQVPLSVTRAQGFEFEAKTKIIRTAGGDIAQPITYVIDSIDTHDPLVWTLILVRTGA